MVLITKEKLTTVAVARASAGQCVGSAYLVYLLFRVASDIASALYSLSVARAWTSVPREYHRYDPLCEL